jgi:hypothetical protein
VATASSNFPTVPISLPLPTLSVAKIVSFSIVKQEVNKQVKMVKVQVVFTLATLAVANAFSPQQMPSNVSDSVFPLSTNQYHHGRFSFDHPPFATQKSHSSSLCNRAAVWNVCSRNILGGANGSP